MLKKILISLTLSFLVLLAIVVVTPLRGGSAQPASRTAQSAVATGTPTDTVQKMIVDNGTVTMDLDLNRLSGISSATQNLQQTHFAVGANSFFPVVVFNDQLRGPLPGTMALVPAESVEAAVPAAASQATCLPPRLSASVKQLVVEKLPSGQGTDLAVRDSNTGFTFFNIQGNHYTYDSAAQSLAITNGRLLVSKEFANALGRPSDAGATVGTISIGAAMQPIEVTQLANGRAQSLVMPPLQHTLSPETPKIGRAHV